MKEMSKKCSTDQRFILKEIPSLKIHTLMEISAKYVQVGTFGQNQNLHLFMFLLSSQSKSKSTTNLFCVSVSVS